jgi:hypothetical protein
VRRPYGPPLRRRAPVVGALALLPLLGSCSDEGGDDDPFADLSAPASAPAATATPTPGGAATTSGGVPGQCSEVVPPTAILDAIGVPLDGTAAFVTAGPVPESGRTGRITCEYGIAPGPDGQPAAKVRLSVNGYVDAATAVGRLDENIARAQGQGQQVRALALDGRPGYVLRDAVDVTYLVADADRTVVATMVIGLVPPEAEQVALTEIVSAMLGVQPGAPSTPTPTPTTS